jgi:hypothetical protein
MEYDGMGENGEILSKQSLNSQCYLGDYDKGSKLSHIIYFLVRGHNFSLHKANIRSNNGSITLNPYFIVEALFCSIHYIVALNSYNMKYKHILFPSINFTHQETES